VADGEGSGWHGGSLLGGVLAAGSAAVARLVRGDGPVAPPTVAGIAGVAGNAAATRLARSTTVQRAALTAQGAGPLDPQIAGAIDAERGRGAPLPDPLRMDMEQHLGANLSTVRVHTGSAADTLNRAVTAQAFTTGADVFLSAGRYDPASPAGRELLAHELTHVVQQAADPGTGARVSHQDEPAEVQARAVARRVAHSTAEPVAKPEAQPVLRSTEGAVARRARLVARDPERQTNAGALTEAQQRAFVDLDQIAKNASANGDTIAEASDGCLDALQITSKHLTAVTGSYKTAWESFSAIIAKADEEAARVERQMEFFQGLAIATVLGVLGPEMIVLGKLGAEATSLMAKAAQAFTGELAEIGAGKYVDSQREDRKPGDTKELAGPSAGDMFETAFHQLREMIDIMPAMSKPAAMQKDVAMAAYQLKDGVGKNRGAGGVAVVADGRRLEQLVRSLQDLTAGGKQLATNALICHVRIAALMQRAFVVPAEHPDLIERRLWTNWMAKLGDDHELIENEVIKDYLTAKGMVEVIARYRPAAAGAEELEIVDTRKEVLGAQRRWLSERGIDPGTDKRETRSRFEAFQTLDDLRRKALGKTGRVNGSGHNGLTLKKWVEVGDVRLQLIATAFNAAEVGGIVKVTDVRFIPQLDGVNHIMPVWDARMFEADVESAVPAGPGR
jgi:hypothetical protein